MNGQELYNEIKRDYFRLKSYEEQREETFKVLFIRNCFLEYDVEIVTSDEDFISFNGKIVSKEEAITSCKENIIIYRDIQSLVNYYKKIIKNLQNDVIFYAYRDIYNDNGDFYNTYDKFRFNIEYHYEKLKD